MTILLAIFGNKIVTKIGKKSELKKAMGPTFGILGSIVIVVLIISLAVKSADGKTTAFPLLPMMLFFIIGFVYLLLDTWAITNGKYNEMVCKDDYIYGSTKLFADFVLMFTLLANVLG